MTDLSKLSDAELEALFVSITSPNQSAVSNLSAVSDLSDAEIEKRAGLRPQRPQEDPLTLPESVERAIGLAARGAYPPVLGAVAGSALGLLGGAAAPVTVPLGALAGSMALPVADLLTAGYNYLGGKVGLPQIENSPSEFINQYLTRMGLPEPQNTTERVISAIGGAAGGAGGTIPALARLSKTAASPVLRGAAGQMAMNPVSQTIAGATSAGVGQYVGEETDSPTAGMLAGLLSTIPQGVVTSAASRRSTAPTAADLKRSASQVYKEADDSGIVISPDSFTTFAQSVIPELDKVGFDRVLHPRVARAVEVLEERAKTPQTLSQTELFRRIIKSAASSSDKSERNVARVFSDNLDEYVVNLNKKDILGGDPAKAVLLENARNLWSKSSKTETVDELINRAKTKSEDPTGPTYERALRAEFRALALNDSKIRLFNAAEKAAILKVAEGGPVGNALGALGNLAPSTRTFPSMIQSLAGPALGYATFGSPGAIAVPLVGGASHFASKGITSRNARLAEELMRSGGTVYPSKPTLPYGQNLARLLTRGSMPLPDQVED